MTTKFLRNIALALIFIIPFIVLIAPSDSTVNNPSQVIFFANFFFFPFITGKAFAFRILVEIIFTIWLVLLLRDKKYAPKFSKLSLFITLFTVVVFITDMLGMNPLRSFWSNSERMEGWIMIAHLWAYFTAVTAIFGTGEHGRRMWHTFFKTTLFVASIVAIYGFCQLRGWAQIHQGSTRIDSSLGNAAYMAVYMLIHSFIAFYMSLVNWQKKNVGKFWTYGVLGIIFAYFLFETATRGTILGFVGGIMLALGIYAVFGKGESTKFRWISGGSIILIILLGVLLVANKDTAFVKGNETLDRLASISLSESKGQARGYIWPMAIKGVFESPKTAFLGVGQENFNYIFNANYHPQMWTQEQWFDRAHSVFLDWLVAGGIIALLLYISLFVFGIMAIWKSHLTFTEKCLMTGLFVGYAIHNVFVFDNIASYFLFFTLLGFVHSLTAHKSIAWLERADTQSENTLVVRDYIFVPVIVIAFALTLYFINIRPIQANTRLITAMQYCNAGQPYAELYARALDMNQYMLNQEIREQLFGCATGAINIANSKITIEEKRAFYELALKEIDNQIKSTPLDARAYVLAGTFLNAIGDWQTAQPFLEKANQLSPNKQSLMSELAKNYVHSGKEKEAAVLLGQAYDSAPEHDGIKKEYVNALVASGQEAKAKELFGKNPELFLNIDILSAYVISKQYQKAIDGYKLLIQKSPDDLRLQGSLAEVYAISGQYYLAISVLENMKVKFPQVKETIDQAIQQVKGMIK